MTEESPQLCFPLGMNKLSVNRSSSCLFWVIARTKAALRKKIGVIAFFKSNKQLQIYNMEMFWIGRVSNKISSSALLSSPEQLDRQKQALLTFGRINLSSASIQHWQTFFWECSPQCSRAEPAWLWDYELEKGLWAVHTMDSILKNVGTNPCPVGRGSCSAHLLLHKSLLVFLALWTKLNWSFFITLLYPISSSFSLPANKVA